MKSNLGRENSKFTRSYTPEARLIIYKKGKSDHIKTTMIFDIRLKYSWSDKWFRDNFLNLVSNESLSQSLTYKWMVVTTYKCNLPLSRRGVVEMIFTVRINHTWKGQVDRRECLKMMLNFERNYENNEWNYLKLYEKVRDTF